MQIFQLSPDGFKKVKEKLLFRGIILGAIALTIGFYIAIANQNEDAETSIFEILPFMIPIFIIALGVGIFKGLKRQKTGWDSFQLTIEEDAITRSQNNIPDIMIRKEEIREIFENPDGSLVINTDEKLRFIGIPASVQNRVELLNLLENFGEIQQKSGKGNKGYLTIIASLAVLGLMAVFFIAKSEIFIIPTGILLTAALIWSFVQTQKSNLVDKKTKRSSYFISTSYFFYCRKIDTNP